MRIFQRTPDLSLQFPDAPHGEETKVQSDLGSILTMVWLTPAMDRLFIEGSDHRRRFLDRLNYSFDPAYSSRLSQYSQALRQRSKLLKERRYDDSDRTFDACRSSDGQPVYKSDGAGRTVRRMRYV